VLQNEQQNEQQSWERKMTVVTIYTHAEADPEVKRYCADAERLSRLEGIDVKIVDIKADPCASIRDKVFAIPTIRFEGATAVPVTISGTCPAHLLEERVQRMKNTS
jgi:hypothetical protein